MKFKKYFIGKILISLLVFCGFINPIFADFELGGSSVPIDEDGFIEYDFEDKVASGKYRLKVEFVNLFRFHFDETTSALGVNITVSKLNSNTDTYETLTIESQEYQNLACLLYNKTLQFFRYSQYMNNLLLLGYGGYYIIPNDPVDVNIVKVFVEGYTNWSATVNGRNITIDLANKQTILTYNEQGILIKGEIMSNNIVISNLTFIEYTIDQTDDNDILDIVIIVSIIAIIVIIVVVAYKISFKKR